MILQTHVSDVTFKHLNNIQFPRLNYRVTLHVKDQPRGQEGQMKVRPDGALMNLCVTHYQVSTDVEL